MSAVTLPNRELCRQIQNALFREPNGFESPFDGYTTSIVGRLATATQTDFHPTHWQDVTIVFTPADEAETTMAALLPNPYEYDRVLGHKTFREHARVAKEARYLLRDYVDLGSDPFYWSGTAFKIGKSIGLYVTHRDGRGPNVEQRYEALAKVANDFPHLEFYIYPSGNTVPRVVRSH